MLKKKLLPIGYDSFRKIRETDKYLVDKTMMIRDFIEYNDEVALVTRPRRFGKTLNMTMLRDFFDITQESREIFEGLTIMDTEYAGLINTRPVIYFTLKDCDARTPEYLAERICDALAMEYEKYFNIAKRVPEQIAFWESFEEMYRKVINGKATLNELSKSVSLLLQTAYEIYRKPVILLWDEYDTPVMCSYQYGYHDEISDFIANFYGSTLKGQQFLGQALLTGIQRMVKESIFSKLNNVKVYTVLDKWYAQYFGFTAEETREILEYYGLSLNDDVTYMYDGYCIGGCEIYNPWSILNYCERQDLRSYWVNTSSNTLIRESLANATQSFRHDFEKLAQYGEAEVSINLETSYGELQNDDTLWGLFVNAGYLTIKEKTGYDLCVVRFVNNEVKNEFKNIVAESIGTNGGNFSKMMRALLRAEYEKFFENYKQIILNCTSYYDAVQHAGQFENPYHMLTLGMMISLDAMYDIKSNYESGDGRADIRMLSKEPDKRAHIIIEFKCDEDTKAAAKKALQQIYEKRYVEGLRAMAPTGKILCLGIAHYKKKCDMEYEMVE